MEDKDTTMNEFVERLIDFLNNESRYLVDFKKEPLDVCFMVSVIEQRIGNCKELLDDISKYEYEFNYYRKDEETYISKINILIKKPFNEITSEYMCDSFMPWHYEMEFGYDERLWSYCQCSPTDQGYDEEHKCCGNGCDWFAPVFCLDKISVVGGGGWLGNEKSYWEYEKKFNANEKNKNNEVEKYKREQKKISLEKQLFDIQKQLEELGA